MALTGAGIVHSWNWTVHFRRGIAQTQEAIVRIRNGTFGRDVPTAHSGC